MDYVRFGELYSIPSSNGLSRPSGVRGEGYRMIGMGELFANDIIRDMEMERVQMSKSEQEKFLVSEGDLLFARQSLVAAGAGKCSVVEEIKEPTTFESHLIRVRLDKEECNPWFYYYMFKLDNNPIKAIVNQCAQAGIRGSELIRVKVPKIEKDTQNSIVNVLHQYDSLIELNNKRIKLLEQMAEMLYRHTFSSEKIKWYEEQLKLKEVITIIRGVSYSSDEIECDEGNALINLKNIQGFGGFRADGTKRYSGKYKKEQIVKTGDLVMGVTDMTQDRRTVGAVVLLPILKETSVISADLIKIESDIDNIFLYSLFRFGKVSNYIAQFANGANVLHLRPQSIENIKVNIPPEDVIDRFVGTVKPMVEEINQLNEANDNLIKQRDLLLPRLMSGKLEV